MTNLKKNQTFSSSMSKASNYNHWIVESFAEYISGNLLEIGIGHGGFYNLLKDKIDSYSGLDIDPELVKNAKELFPENNYHVGDISTSQLHENIPLNNFDTILCCNVLEHIENDKESLVNLLSLLKPSGKLLLFVPAFMQLYNDMDKLAGHHRRYTKNSLSNMVPENSEIKLLCYFNSIGGLGWWCNKFASHDTLECKSVSRQVEFFDNIVLPFAKITDKMTSAFFGQSLICVLQKRNNDSEKAK